MDRILNVPEVRREVVVFMDVMPKTCCACLNMNAVFSDSIDCRSCAGCRRWDTDREFNA